MANGGGETEQFCSAVKAGMSRTKPDFWEVPKRTVTSTQPKRSQQDAQKNNNECLLQSSVPGWYQSVQNFDMKPPNIGKYFVGRKFKAHPILVGAESSSEFTTSVQSDQEMMQAYFPCMSSQSAGLNVPRIMDDQAFEASESLLLKVIFAIVNGRRSRSPLLRVRILVCSLAKITNW